jgi:hypothetical protein
MILNSPFISGSLTVTGNTILSGSITSLAGIAGTASYATNADMLDGLDSTSFLNTSSFNAMSSSFSSRVANTEATASAFVTASGSLAARLVSNEAKTGSYATTGSNQFNGNQTVTGSLTATGTIVAQTLVVQTITSSVDFVTGSARFGSNTGNTHQFTGSVLVSGSQTINGTLNGVAATFSGLITGQAGILLSTTQAINTAGSIGYNSTQGIFIYTKAGSAYDFKLYNGVGSTTIQIPTGTQNVEFLGTASFASSIAAAQLNISNVGGKFTGEGGATNYLGIYKDDGTPLFRVISNGSGAATFSGSVTANGGLISAGSPNGYPLGELQFSLTTAGSYAGISTNGTTTPTLYFDHRATSNTGNFVFRNGTAGANTLMYIAGGGNIGVGLTSPQSQLHMNGVLTFTESGYDTARLHTITHAHSAGNNPNNYIAFNVSDGGGTTAERMRINGAGNVGIGTSSPSYQLDVNGTGRFSGNVGITVSDTPQLLLTHSNTSRTFLMAVDGSNAFFRSNSTNNILFQYAGGTTALTINGSTGAATFSSSVTASGGVIAGDSKFFNSVQLTDSLGGTCQGFLWTDAANTLKIGTGTVAGGNVKMTILSGGNVGIGTTSPGARLQIKASAAAGATDAFYIENSAGTGLFSVRDDGLTYLKGNVGINTATPSVRLEVNGNYKLFGGSTYTSYTGDGLWNAAATPNFIGTNGQGSTYNRYTGINGGILLGYQDNGSGLYSPAYGFEVKSTDGRPVTGNVVKAIVIKDTDTNTLVFYVNNNGNVLNVNNSYGSTSDISLKENIVDATPKLNDLLNVKIRNYNLKADPNQTKQIGVIAQELEEIFPGMIETDTEGIKSVKYSVFVPMLIKSIQELKAELNISNQKIAALESTQ